MKDARGAEVNVGDTVIYFTRQSSSMRYHVGQVAELTTRKAYPKPEDVARVEITAERYSWRDRTRRPPLVSGVNLLVVTGLPEVKAE